MNEMPHLRLVQPVTTAEIPVQVPAEVTIQDLAAKLVGVATGSAPRHTLENIPFPETLNEFDVRYIGNRALTLVDRSDAKVARRKTLGLLGVWALSQGNIEVAHESADHLQQIGGFWARREARSLRQAIRKSQG